MHYLTPKLEYHPVQTLRFEPPLNAQAQLLPPHSSCARTKTVNFK